MSHNCSFSECVYLDTNILSLAVEHSEWYRPFFNFLFRNHLYIAFSDSLLLELSQAARKHADFNTFFTILPWGKVKSFGTVIDEEVKSYPNVRSDPLLVCGANLEVKSQTVAEWLVSDKVREDWRKQQLCVNNMKRQLDYVKSNFPPSTMGVYSKEQAEVFAWMVAVQWLGESHPAFIKKLNDNRVLLKAGAFFSIKLYAYYVYYKYYLGNRQPKELSDFGELFHLFYFPYCKLIILERDMCNILNEIKSNCNVLGGVEVKNVDFFTDHH
jgi:hypothetical protein